MTESEWALVAATIGLAVATGVLAYFTRSLYKVTGQLAKIEERRDREEARRTRRSRVGRKLELAEEVIGLSPESLVNPLVSGSLPKREATMIRKLHHHIDYGSDQVLKVDMDRLLLALDGASRGASYDKDAIEDLENVLKRVQERLSWDLFKWRNELIDLSPGLE